MSNNSPGIVHVGSTATLANSSNLKGFIQYISRDNALNKDIDGKEIETEKLIESDRFKNYMLYQENKDKTLERGAFTKDSYSIDDKEMKEILKKCEIAEKNGCLMFQDVLSFDNKYLEEIGLYNPLTNELNEKKLIDTARQSFDKMIDNEKMDKSAFYVGAIHRNTDNIHIHVATLEMKNSRPMMYTPELKRMYPKYKREPKNFKAIKSEMANGINQEKTIELRKNLNFYNKEIKSEMDKVLNRPIHTDNKNKDLFKLKIQLNDIKDELPENKKLWRYNSNAKEMQKPKLLTKQFIDNMIENEPEMKKAFNEYIKDLEKEEKEFIKLYGENKNKPINTKEKKIERLYSELGNKVFNELKQFDQKQNKEIDRILRNGAEKRKQEKEQKEKKWRDYHLAQQKEYQENQKEYQRNKQEYQGSEQEYQENKNNVKTPGERFEPEYNTAYKFEVKSKQNSIKSLKSSLTKTINQSKNQNQRAFERDMDIAIKKDKDKEIDDSISFDRGSSISF